MGSWVVANDPEPGNAATSFGYSAGKAGIDPLAGVVNAEFSDQGIVAYTVEPGLVSDRPLFQKIQDRFPDAPVNSPEAIGAAIIWVLTDPAARRLGGSIFPPSPNEMVCSDEV